jgi:hypothetical protein
MKRDPALTSSGAWAVWLAQGRLLAALIATAKQKTRARKTMACAAVLMSLAGAVVEPLPAKPPLIDSLYRIVSLTHSASTLSHCSGPLGSILGRPPFKTGPPRLPADCYLTRRRRLRQPVRPALVGTSPPRAVFPDGHRASRHLAGYDMVLARGLNSTIDVTSRPCEPNLFALLPAAGCSDLDHTRWSGRQRRLHDRRARRCPGLAEACQLCR